MKALIITVAGTATRFNRDTQSPTLKCLYGIGSYKNTLLYQILDKAREFDEFVIVGGYLFDKLKSFVDENLLEFKDKIKLINNPEYANFGSGYSLLLGLLYSCPKAEEIIFVEGDLYYEKNDFEKIKQSPKSVFTVNHELITARKSVVVYEKEDGYLRYLYDTSHSYLYVPEPFLAIYNSGQVWKFQNIEKLTKTINSLTSEQTRGTNLEIIQGYFGDLDPCDYEMVEFNTWHNCNTIEDYKIVYSKMKDENA